MGTPINKVFGIGLSRTGTTSLTGALEILGYRTSHWEDHDQINQHLIQNQFTLDLLEYYDAITDNPIPSIYQELDKAYPNSKFVLTVRDFDSWLKSVEQHHLVNVGPTFPSFNTKLCFGSWYFDEKQFTRTYYEHEEEVKAYFKDRPGDLLIINICDGEGWEKLCPFLGQGIPSIAFPHQNQMDYSRNQIPNVHPEQKWKNRKNPTDEAQALRHELDAIYASKSWRAIQWILTPVRWWEKVHKQAGRLFSPTIKKTTKQKSVKIPSKILSQAEFPQTQLIEKKIEMMLGEVKSYQHQYDYQAAQAVLEGALSKYPHHFQLKQAHAYNYWLMGNYHEAHTIYELIQPEWDFTKPDIYPKFAKPYIDILLIQNKIDKLESFLKEVKGARNINRDVVMAYCHLLVNQGKYHKAEAFIDTTLKRKALKHHLVTHVLLLFEREKIKHVQALNMPNFQARLDGAEYAPISPVLQEIKPLVLAHPAHGQSENWLLEAFEKFSLLAEKYPQVYLNTATSPIECYLVVDHILSHINSKTPYSLIRLGDGEGHFLPYDEQKRHAQKADQLISQKIWWGKGQMSSEAWEKIEPQYLAALEQADIIGIPDPIRCSKVALRSQGDKAGESFESRGLLAVINRVIKQASFKESHHKTVTPRLPLLTSCHIHTQLEELGFWNLILDNIKSCSLISCHDSLPHLLQEQHGIHVQKFFHLPPENKYAQQMGLSASTDSPHFPKQFEDICERLTVDGPGEVFIVAAGFLGKIYCHLIKQKGGIALDVGSVVDYWLNFKTRVFTNSPKPPAYLKQLYNLIGQSLLSRRYYKSASKIFEKLIQDFPQSPQGHIGMASIAARRKEWSLAQERWQKVLTLFPKNPQALFESALAMVNLGAFDAAKPIFQSFLVNPTDPMGYEGMASMAIAQYKREEALSWLNQSIAQTHAKSSYRRKAKFLVNHAQYDAGIKTIDAMMAHHGSSHNASVFKAGLWIIAGQYHEAITLLENLYSQFPRSKDVQRLLAQALIGARQYERASNFMVDFPVPTQSSTQIEDPNYILRLLKTWKKNYLGGAGNAQPKVFGIGLSRTGTTSLTDALNILGYAVIHFINPITRKVLDLEDFYYYDAFTDSPVSYRFEELYALFPNAIFIYTERNLTDWVRSSSNLYRPRGFTTTKEFKAWLAKPKSESGLLDKLYHDYNPIYQAAYGSLYTQYPNWEAAYHAFDERVNRFFADKPAEKLLKIDITKENGWEKLCAFLEKPIPNAPFPHANKLSHKFKNQKK